MLELIGLNECEPDYTRTLNQDPKEELAWKSPFEVYYGHKPNRLHFSNDTLQHEWILDSGSYRDLVTCTRPKDYTAHENNVRKIRKSAKRATRTCEERRISRGLRNKPPSTYSVLRVLIQRPCIVSHSFNRIITPAFFITRTLYIVFVLKDRCALSTFLCD